MGQLTLISARVEERPRFFDFKKSDFTSHHPAFPNLNYDPFPNAGQNEVVRTEIIARELVLHAKLTGAVGALNMGMALNYEGKKFGIQEIKETFGLETDECSYEVIATTKVVGEDPMEVLTRLRASMASAN